ncbi:guanylate kinase [Salinibius halmophilus]|uniref:guanylate kinase n=1 Tax=Salinibius halmophilus TaxID=1853216 RepID=UPI000E66E68E|nr:guanylate kinase [Salinibius halmophilus]
MSAGKLFVISAPSGAGKSSLVSALCERDASIQVSVSHTTRAPRPGEEDGVNYNFTTIAEFEAGIDSGLFLEYAKVFDNYYGTSGEWVTEQLAQGIDVILEIDWQGAQQVRKLVPNCTSIFILPPSVEALEQRLNNRGQDGADVIARRMKDAQSEMSHWHEFEYVVINDAFSTALDELHAIFVAERQKQARQAINQQELIESLLS